MLMAPRASFLAPLLTLLMLSKGVSASNYTSAPLISNNGTENGEYYNVPKSNPPTSLYFATGTEPQLVPQLALLAIIEGLQPICEHHNDPIPPTSALDYAGVRIILINHPGRPLRYRDACTALRGLAEFMVTKNGFNAWTFEIGIRGRSAGSGEILASPPSLSATASDVETS